jgi:hypothetical protein
MQQLTPSGAQRTLRGRADRIMCTATIIASHKEFAVAHVLEIRDTQGLGWLLRRLEALLDGLMLPFAEEIGRLSPSAFRHLLNARF